MSLSLHSRMRLRKAVREAVQHTREQQEEPAPRDAAYYSEAIGEELEENWATIQLKKAQKACEQLINQAIQAIIADPRGEREIRGSAKQLRVPPTIIEQVVAAVLKERNRGWKSVGDDIIYGIRQAGND